MSVLILNETSFPKQGTHSVGVARQYCGTAGKVAHCQVAVTAALSTGVRAWMLDAALYLPESWLTDAARQRVQVPATVRFQEKWRLTLLRQARAAGIRVTAVPGDAEFGDNRTLRQHLHRNRLPYALGVSATLTVWRAGAPRAEAVRAIAAQLPPRTWRLVSWRNGPIGRGRRTSRQCALRPRTDGRIGGPRRSGCCWNATSARRRASKPISSRCRRPRRCASSCGWRISAGRSSSSTRN